MRNRPVHWFEGMFLRPQHFQASDRYWTECVATSEQWDEAYHYGIRSVTLSQEALASFQVQVSQCEARLRDGTLVTFEAHEAPQRRDLKEAFAAESEVMLYLAVPKLDLGRANVTAGNEAGDQRYTARATAVQDETTGGGDQEIQFLEANVRLLLSTDELTGFEVLPLARIKRAGESEATPQLDADYFPPVLNTDAWTPLGLGIVRSVYDVIGEKIEVLSQRVLQRGITFTSQEPGDLNDLFMLFVLNQSHAVLHCLTFARGVHPQLAYRELCRVVGMLAIFDPSRRVEDIPRYDHDDLARVFKWLKLRIEILLGTSRELAYQQRFFVGTERGMHVAIESDWLHSGWEWYVGVHGHNISEDDCRELLRPGKLDWKMGSSQQVDLIFKHGMPGVERAELRQTPRSLPTSHGWVYYEVKRENSAWKDVLATQTLALRFKTELIGNLGQLKGQRCLEVLHENKRAILEFALFAVRPAKT